MNDLKREFLRRKQAAEERSIKQQSAKDDYSLDDLSARYQSLDNTASWDQDGTGDTSGKETRRLDELKEQASLQNAKGGEEQYEASLLDDFAPRYDALKEVSTNKDGTFRKDARRLEEIKQQAFRKKQAASLLNAQKQLLGDEADDGEPLRLDLLQRQTNE